MNIYTYEFENRFCVIVAQNQPEADLALAHVTANHALCNLVSVTPTLGGWVVHNTILPF